MREASLLRPLFQIGNDKVPAILLPHERHALAQGWAVFRLTSTFDLPQKLLAHTIPDKTEAAPACSDLFARRWGLME